MERRLRFVGLAGALFLAACATAAPEPAPEEVREDPRITALLEAVEAELAANPGDAPRGLQISVNSVEDTGEQLIFDVLFAAPEIRAHNAEDFTVYVSCGRNDLGDCTRRLVDAARTLKRVR